MQVRVPMTRKVITVPPSLLISHCWTIMEREQIRHLPVVDSGCIVGILSDRDLLRIGNVLPSGELAFVRRHVADIMTLAPIVCAPEVSVSDAARIMTEKKIDALPIAVSGRLIGLVTSTDLMHLLIDSPELPLPFDFQIEMVGSVSA